MSSSNTDLLDMCLYPFPIFIPSLKGNVIIVTVSCLQNLFFFAILLLASNLTTIEKFRVLTDDPTSLRNWMASKLQAEDGSIICQGDRNAFVAYFKNYITNNHLPELVEQSGGSTSLATSASVCDIEDDSKTTNQESPSQAATNDTTTTAAADTLPIATTTVEISNVPDDVSLPENLPYLYFYKKQLLYLVSPLSVLKENLDAILPNGTFNYFKFDYKKSNWPMSPEAVLEQWKQSYDHFMSHNQNPAQEWPLPVDFMIKITSFVNELWNLLAFIFPFEIPMQISYSVCQHFCDERKNVAKFNSLYLRFKNEFPSTIEDKFVTIIVSISFVLLPFIHIYFVYFRTLWSTN